MDLNLLIDAGLVILGWGIGWLSHRVIIPTGQPYPYNPLPIVSAGQAVTVIFTKDDLETAHRRVEAVDLLPILVCPKNGPPEHEYTYSHLDERGRFIYVFTKDLT